MNSIQRLRSQAQDEGNLQSTPQENVVADAGIVEIRPTNPAVIYVPSYPWDTIYDDPGIYCTFGIGFPIGPWLGCDWDWRNHHVIAWGAGHPRDPAIGGGARRAIARRRRVFTIWHPASRVAASASRGADRGFSAATYGAARVHTPATPAPQEGLPARAGIAPRAGVAAASRGMIVGGARPEGCPTGSRSGGGIATGNRVKASGPDAGLLSRRVPRLKFVNNPVSARLAVRRVHSRRANPAPVALKAAVPNVRAIVRFRPEAMKEISAPKWKEEINK